MAVKKKGGNVQAQLNIKGIPVELITKLQSMADIEGVSYNELYIKAFSTLVALYEKKHGKIKPKPQGRGLENLID